MGDFAIEAVEHPGEPWDALEALFLGLHRHHEAWQDRRLRDDWSPRWREFVKPGPDGLILLARRDGEPIGYLGAQIRRDYGLFDELVGFLNEIYVEPEFRGKGVGRALLQYCEGWCKDRGATQLDLTVLTGNQKSVEFWRRAGFSPVSYRMSKPLEAAS